MKTLSFHNFKVGRKQKSLLLHLDTESQGIRFSSGLQIIIAPNGCGKTSLLQSIAGVLPMLSGETRLDGKKTRPEQEALYTSEYLTFPKFIYPSEWIEFVSGKKFDQNALAPFVAGFSMASPFRSFMGRMSQGERRKVTWLAAHASSKPVLLLDEPLNGLDLSAIECARHLVEAWKREGRIVCIVAHQPGEFLDLSDDVFWIKGGRLHAWSQGDGNRQSYKALSAEGFRKEVLRHFQSLPL